MEYPVRSVGKDPGGILDEMVIKESKTEVESGKLTEQVARVYLLKFSLTKEN